MPSFDKILYDISIDNPTTVSLYPVSMTDTTTLYHTGHVKRAFLANTFKMFSDAGGTTQLLRGTDFVLIQDDQDIAYSASKSVAIYSSFKGLKVLGNVYITCDVVASYNSAQPLNEHEDRLLVAELDIDNLTGEISEIQALDIVQGLHLDTLDGEIYSIDNRLNTDETNIAALQTGKQDILGYTPVQTGTGIGQLPNIVKIGWSGASLKVTVDETNIGNILTDGNLISVLETEASVSSTNITALGNLTGANTGDQHADGVTITGTGTIADPFVSHSTGGSGGGGGGVFDGAIADGSLEFASGITTDQTTYIDMHSSFPIIDYDARIIRYAGVNGSLTITQNGNGYIYIATDNAASTHITSTLDSDSSHTGALVVSGGLGVAKALNVAGGIGTTTIGANSAAIFDLTDSTSTATGAFRTSGGVGIAKNLYVGGCLATSPNYMSTHELEFDSASYAPFDVAALASGTVAQKAGDANHPGIVTISSSTTTNSGYYIKTKASSLLISGGEVFTAIFRPLYFTNTTTYLGLHTSITSTTPLNGLYFLIPPTGYIISQNSLSGGGLTQPGGGYLLTINTWYRAEIIVNYNATSVLYNVYDCLTSAIVCTSTLTTNIPNLTGHEVGAGVVAINSGTSALALIDLDYMKVSCTRKLVR